MSIMSTEGGGGAEGRGGEGGPRARARLERERGVRVVGPRSENLEASQQPSNLTRMG